MDLHKQELRASVERKERARGFPPFEERYEGFWVKAFLAFVEKGCDADQASNQATIAAAHFDGLFGDQKC